MSERILDRLKNVLIVLLLLCIAVLSLMAMPPGVVQSLHLPPTVMRLLGVPVGAEAQPSRSTQTSAAAQPMLISVRNEAGRSTAQRSFSALDRLYDRLSPLLIEALQTASSPREAEQSELYDALSRESVLFDYGAQLPLSAVRDWLGAENPAPGGSVRRLLLAEEDGTVCLYLPGDTCVRWETELSTAALSEALADYAPDGSVFFAEEPPQGDATDPLTLREGAVALPNAVAEFPEDGSFAEAVATVLNFNPYGSGVYTDADGNRIFTENNRSCSVASDGTILFTDSEEAVAASAASASANIESVRAIAASIHALVPNDARLYLCAWEEDGDLTHCRFRYVLDGVPIAPDAVTATLRGSRLTEFRFAVRTCHTDTGRISLLPLPQALAIADTGKSLTAAYHDSGRGALTCGWIQS
ncbi:MAG: hypothetical protein IKA78_06475 [Oscillospiraceae bacterium]|nr:hypothetical protein [Oscillospiraceae bacterium]